MKKSLFILIFFIFCANVVSFAQNKAQDLQQNLELTTPKMTFVETVYDFGKAKLGEKISTAFYFKNTGTKPLQILQVQASCGCTASKWKKELIQPNEVSEITVTFDTAYKGDMTGKQSKYLLIISNSPEKEQKLTIQGEVSN